MKFHPLREQVVSEVHARPFQQLYSPFSLIHLAIVYDGPASRGELLQQVLAIAEAEGLEAQPGSFFFLRNGKTALRYETHNEFCTLTFYRFGTLALPARVEQYMEGLSGEFLCGVEVICSEPQGDALEEWVRSQFQHQICGSEVMGGAGKLWTDFHPRSDSPFTRILIEDHALSSYQRGRLSQRLCEIEVYRHMALLALPDAVMAMPRITEYDATLAQISLRMASETPAELLEELTQLAGEVEVLSASTANRFGATDAYFALLDKRIDELRETRIEGLQTVEQFMERRADPARRTCWSAGRRIERLSQQIVRTSQLIRSQVDLSTEQQMRDLLAKLSSRARSQLRLQAKLESFTVIVVTYYAFDLIERSLRNTLRVDQALDLALFILSGAVPVIALLLWLYIRRMLKGIEDE